MKLFLGYLGRSLLVSGGCFLASFAVLKHTTPENSITFALSGAFLGHFITLLLWLILSRKEAWWGTRALGWFIGMNVFWLGLTVFNRIMAR